MKRSILALTCLFSLLTFFVPAIKAETNIPSFPSCVNPIGTLKADNEGVHGIVGDTDLHTGNDKVFTLTDSTLIQCFCSASGAGIQTNWLKVSGLTQDEIDDFKTQGWVFIPDGSLWGLDPSAYLARNVNYTCNGGGDSGGSGDSGGTGGTGGGEVLGAATGIGGAVLGLAATGTTSLLVALLVAGIALTAAGVYLRRNEI